MTSSGTYTYGLANADVITEAFERCGKSPESLTSEHLESALRGLNLLFSAWETEGARLWHMVQTTHTTAISEQSFALSAGVIDIGTVFLRRDGTDIPMYPISREDYANIPDKDVTGRPTRYWVERAISPTIYYWPAGENATDVIYYYQIKQFEDAGTLQNTPDAPRRWGEAICSGLAANLAVKYAPERLDRLYLLADRAFKNAHRDDQEAAPLVLSPKYGQRGRRRR